MRRFNLIQRGSIKKVNPDKDKLTTLIGREGLVELDYMGSAEFEWGAIPAAYTRIMMNYDKYKMIQAPEYFNNHSTGQPLILLCMDDRRDRILTELQKFIKDPYHLKEVSYLPENVKGSRYDFPKHVNFWWCIDSVRPSWLKDHPEDDISDWIAFYGNGAAQMGIEALLRIDHDDWWENLDESTRKQKIKTCYDR